MSLLRLNEAHTRLQIAGIGKSRRLVNFVDGLIDNGRVMARNLAYLCDERMSYSCCKISKQNEQFPFLPLTGNQRLVQY